MKPAPKGELDTSVPAPPIGKASVRRTGRDVTVITYGSSLVDTALAAADLSAGHDLEVIDLRSLNPLDFDTIAASVRKTGRVVIMHEARARWGSAPSWLRGSPRTSSTTSRHPCCAPPALTRPIRRPGWRKLWLPGVDRLLDCVDKAMSQP